MSLIRLLRAHSQIDPAKLAGMAALSGIGNAAVLALVNAAAADVTAGKSTIKLFFMFVAAVGVFAVAQRYVLVTSMRDIEQIVSSIRVRLFEKVVVSDLPVLEGVGRSSIFTAIATETQTISQAVTVLVMGTQGAILLAFATVYLAFLSLPALAFCAGFTLLAVAVMSRRNKPIVEGFLKASAEESDLFSVLDSTLTGFKETKMNAGRADGLLEDFRGRSADAIQARITSRVMLAEATTLSQALIFVLIGVLVFVVPVFFPSTSPNVQKTATAVLFMIGPLSAMANAVPFYNMANAAATTVEAIESALTADAGDGAATPHPFPGFSRIVVEGLRFRHANGRGGKAFEVGPIDFEIAAGETMFVTGGNGSGKTTFMQLLIGLRRPMAGRIRVDGRPVDEASLQDYRNLFAVVFSDCHIFRRLYGLGEPDMRFVDAWLDKLEIRDKTRIEAGAFSTIDLSAGQRKRIALLVALLEDRPIVVLDEWAADQDPHFRGKFYRELLPELKALGKTVIAITHDDRYFDAADRRVLLNHGRLEPEGGDPGRSD